MDLALYGRVLRRFGPLVATGVILAAGLAILSLARVTSHGLSYRKPVRGRARPSSCSRNLGPLGFVRKFPLPGRVALVALPRRNL